MQDLILTDRELGAAIFDSQMRDFAPANDNAEDIPEPDPKTCRSLSRIFNRASFFDESEEVETGGFEGL